MSSPPLFVNPQILTMNFTWLLLCIGVYVYCHYRGMKDDQPINEQWGE